jgi:dihydroorotate dehydrogenase
MRLVGAIVPVREVVRRSFSAPTKPVQAFGLTFANPVGLAAGYDKDGLGWRGLASLGFGHIEVGTVTPLAQPGNPNPRVFRLVEDRAIINRMGFPGRGAEFVARQLRKPRPVGCVIGVNLGKNKDTPLEEAAGDYVSLLRTFANLGDYLAINVSSPNTLGLRRLQARNVGKLLSTLNQARKEIHLCRCPKSGSLLASWLLVSSPLSDGTVLLIKHGWRAAKIRPQREGLFSFKVRRLERDRSSRSARKFRNIPTHPGGRSSRGRVFHRPAMGFSQVWFKFIPG